MMIAFWNIYLCQVIYMFSHLILYQHCEDNRAVIRLILHIRKLKPKDIKLFDNDYTASKKWKYYLSLVLKLREYGSVIIIGGKGEKRND